MFYCKNRNVDDDGDDDIDDDVNHGDGEDDYDDNVDGDVVVVMYAYVVEQS